MGELLMNKKKKYMTMAMTPALVALALTPVALAEVQEDKEVSEIGLVDVSIASVNEEKEESYKVVDYPGFSESDIERIDGEIDKINEDRQFLIKKGIQTGDWQDYRAFQFKYSPEDFVIEDGKLEYSKTYYGKLIETSIRWFNSPSDSIVEQRKDPQAVLDSERNLKELIADFNKAGGKVPYVVGFNNSREVAKDYDAPRPEYLNLSDLDLIGQDEVDNLIKEQKGNVVSKSDNVVKDNVVKDNIVKDVVDKDDVVAKESSKVIVQNKPVEVSAEKGPERPLLTEEIVFSSNDNNGDMNKNTLGKVSSDIELELVETKSGDKIEKPVTELNVEKEIRNSGKTVIIQTVDGTKEEVYNVFADGFGSDHIGEDDELRREDLSKELGIDLKDEDRWGAPRVEEGYTSLEDLQDNIYYGVNASRQDLIKFSIRTGNWDAYNAFEAFRTPAYFEKIDGKFIHNKVYYGNLIESSLRWFNSPDYADQRANPQAIKDSEFRLKELIADYKTAPGIIPYVIGLNSNESYANTYGVERPSNSYFDSKYNGAGSTGIFRVAVDLPGTIANK